MEDKREGLWKTTGTALGLIALAFFLLIVFFGGGKLDAGQVVLRLALPIVIYAAVVTALAGRKAELFDPEKLNNPKEREEALKVLGAVPLITLLIITLCSLVFLAPFFLLGQYTGVIDEMKAPLFLLCLSMALLGSAFVYVLSDRLVSQFLAGNNLVLYPRSLREGRLSTKMLIIPLAVAIITFLFAMGLTMLANRSKSESLGFLAVPFFGIVSALAYTLKKNTETLYNTVILQLENLSSSAKKDLKRRVSVCSIDEMGTISGMVNDFSGNIESGMRAIKECQRVLSVAGVTLKQEASAMAGSLTQITGHIGTIRSQSNGQMQSVDESSSAVQQIAKSIEKLNASITRQSSNVSQASASIEELVGNVNSIAMMVGRMMDQFKGVSKASGDGSQVLKESSVKVQEIVQQSKTLQDANRIIAAIASQTNLLAMNAAIEAAHAGEAGRGFAVVADEIRKLAETSTQESAKISAELKQITQTISDIVKGSAASGEAFDQISSRVAETEKLVSELNSAVKEQQEGADQILKTLRDLNDVTCEVNAGSQEMNKGNAVMLSEMKKLQTVSRKISSEVEQISGNIERVNTGAQKVSEMAESNQSAISDITKVANEFEV